MMAKWIFEIVLVTLVFIAYNEAATPLFLQAITSALATIPFSGGPMTTGLVGAKLGIGTKLLFYLGYFGRRTKPTLAPQKLAPSVGSFSEGLQSLPLPYMLSGRFPAMSSGGFQPSGGGFQSSHSSQTFGFDPAQFFQALTAQGVDPNLVMEALNYAGAPNIGFDAPNSGFAANIRNPGFGANNGFASNGMNDGFAASETNTDFGANTGFTSNAEFGSSERNIMTAANGMNTAFEINNKASEMNNRFRPVSSFAIPGESEQNGFSKDTTREPPSETAEEDVESFFSFLIDMDENTCISRLICDIGHNPSFLGEFSENIHSMVRSLDVQPSSRAYQYIDIMKMGRKEGRCSEKFTGCSDVSYDIVKNVAPSVGIPQNINVAVVNQL